MAWFPWTALPARSNMTTGEVVDWLRYRAIDFGAPTAFVDALDDLILAETAQEQIDGLSKELEGVQDKYDDVREALEELIDKLDGEDSPVVKTQALEHARTVLDAT